MWLIRSLMLFVLVAAIGCSPGPAPEAVQPPSGVENAKTVLQGMVDSGTAGSGVMQLQSAISEMKSSDPEKASALEQGAKELSTMSDPAQIKAKAKEMLDSL